MAAGRMAWRGCGTRSPGKQPPPGSCSGATGPQLVSLLRADLVGVPDGRVDLSRTTYTQVLEGVDVTGGPYAPGDLLFPDPGQVEKCI